MKKWICASSLFVLFVAATVVALYCLWIDVQQPQLWWLSETSIYQPSSPMPVFLWLIVNVIFPGACAAMFMAVLSGFWQLAMWACGKWDTK